MILFESRFFPVVPGRHPDDPELIGLPLIDWLCTALQGEGATIVSAPTANEHGWTARVDFGDRHFLIGCHGVVTAEDPAVGGYTLLIQTVPRFLETLTGGTPLEVDDELILTIESLLIDNEIAAAPTVLIDG